MIKQDFVQPLTERQTHGKVQECLS